MPQNVVLKLHELWPEGHEDTLELTDRTLTILPGSQDQLPEELQGEIPLEAVEVWLHEPEPPPEEPDEPGRKRKKKPKQPRVLLRVTVAKTTHEGFTRAKRVAWDSVHFDVPSAHAFADKFAEITGKEVRPKPEAPAQEQEVQEEQGAAPEPVSEAEPTGGVGQ